MRYSEISEAWSQSFVNSTDQHVDVFHNPSKAEFAKLLRKHKAVRGFLDSPTDVYVWDAYQATHSQVAEAIDLWGIALIWDASGADDQLEVYWNNDYNEEFGIDENTNMRKYIEELPVLSFSDFPPEFFR